ncbi:hypothetical protein, partial [Phascolarctobacterium succinatutens]|uniref:hypothetical protein n=1 Tax=Phascolarctobacterium succinatutens TaxID=626940 RepID=UPI004027A01E
YFWHPGGVILQTFYISDNVLQLRLPDVNCRRLNLAKLSKEHHSKLGWQHRIKIKRQYSK